MTADDPSDVSVTLQINASAETAWGLISDVTRMGDWSPETTGCSWRGGVTEASVGAKFKGNNSNGKHKWDTVCVVTDCEPGQVFAFEAKAGPLGISRWEYRFEPTETGCTAAESWTDQRGWLTRKLSPMLSGVKDRSTHNRSTMLTTLERLAATAEGAAEGC